MAKHPGGAPRTTTPPPEECIELGKEMIAWCEKNKPSHLSEWFSIEKMIIWKVWNQMCDREEFKPYYEQALSMVAYNIRQQVIDKSFGQRFLNLYHRDLKECEIEMAQAAKTTEQQDIKTAAHEILEIIKADKPSDGS